MKTFRIVLVLASSLVVVSGGIRVAANTHYSATVTFSDRAGDNITSDYLTSGSHSYVDGGSAKIESGFWQLSGDFVLRQLTGPLPRYLSFSLTPITPAGAPSGSLDRTEHLHEYPEHPHAPARAGQERHRNLRHCRGPA